MRQKAVNIDSGRALQRTVGLLTAIWLVLISPLATAQTPFRPNVIIILADDLGYGDLSVQGHPLIRTANIDRLAQEGQRWTSFYASAPVCNPSRVALVTGRMPARIHANGLNRWADLPDAEVTIAELLKPLGYSTAYVGKWGLTNLKNPPFTYRGAHPNEQGFDYFYGLPDGAGWPWAEGITGTYEDYEHATDKDFPAPLYRQRTVIESPADQAALTEKFTAEAVKWINASAHRPFFLLFAHSAPHVPLFASKSFQHRSKAGPYGDVVEEIDASVGRIVTALEKGGIARNTLIVFTSDNGPWLLYRDLGGSPGPLRDGKHTVWEGGVRVPGIFWWPGRIRPALIEGIGANVDLISTIATLAGATLPQDRTYDSIDLSTTLLQGLPSPRKEWFYFLDKLEAARVDRYKLVFGSIDFLGSEGSVIARSDARCCDYLGTYKSYIAPLLFDLATDLAERWNIADQHPEIVERIKSRVSRYQKSIPGMSESPNP